MALKWQGWLVGLVGLAGLLVFAPLGLYVWASSPSSRPAAAAAAPARVEVADCRVDPVSRRVLAVVEARGGQGAYVVTVEFRDRPPSAGDADARVSRSLVRLPGLTPSAPPARTEAVGPVWPPATVPWCGVAAVAGEG